MVNEQGAFDPNPFGLRKQAEQWRTKQLQDKGNYHPLQSEGRTVSLPQFLSQFQKACVEHHRRSQCETHDLEYPLVVLVGVGFDEELIEMSDESRPKAHYLFFPKLGAEGESALFITYLAGNVHGSVLTELSGQLVIWFHDNRGLKERLSKALNAGPPNGSQPDIRVYPEKRYTKRPPDDDPDNSSRPFSRLIVEIEWMNRDPVELRQKGYSYFYPKSPRDPDYEPNNDANNFCGGFRHVRMFLGCSLFGNSTDLGKMDENDLEYEAALVLWKRNEDNDEIRVNNAIDFGTKQLSAAHKQQYEGDGQGRLPGVTNWTRREKDGRSRTMVIPKKGFLYEVSQISNVDVPLVDIEDFELDINDFVEVFECQLPYEIEEVRKREAKKRRAEEMESNNDE